MTVKADEEERSLEELLDNLDEMSAHRAVALSRLGFTFEQIEELPLRADIAHDADSLLKRGAKHTDVVALLKED